jgi:hypothetical protein
MSSCPQCGGRPARDRHARHLRRFELVFHPLRQPADRPAVRQGGRAMAAGRPVYRRGRACDPCTCSTPASGRGAEADRQARRGRAVQGLFTQGMVTHETYRGVDGRWLAPMKSRTGDNGELIDAAGAPVSAAGSRRCPSRRRTRSTRADRRPLRRRRGALVHAVRQPARARPRMVGGGIEGAARFVQRVWRLLAGGDAERRRRGRALKRKVHRTIAAVGEAIEGCSSTRRSPSFTSWSARSRRRRRRHSSRGDRTLVRLAAPMAPHLAEECWACAGARAGRDADWPSSTRRCWSRTR